ncbi:MAG: hypothetical protein AAF624_04160 [Bacteroidota bacterium]
MPDAVRPWPDAFVSQMVAVRQAVGAATHTAKVLAELAELGLLQHADGANSA